MVVEDDLDGREALTEALSLEGYVVTSVANGREAIDLLLAGDRPALILLDLMMPVMNGWQFLEERERLPEVASIPVLLLSADGHLPDRAGTLAVAGYIAKPIELDELFSKIEGQLARGPDEASGAKAPDS